MSWAVLRFGKYAGETLPAVVLKDPDWFFWAVKSQAFKGCLAREAEELLDKLGRIQIPRRHPNQWDIEFYYERDGQFRGFDIVESGERPEFGRSERAPHLSFLSVRRCKAYDKCTYKRLLRDFRHHYVGKNRRLTKARCESFFENERNFVKLR
jgi:hypothetical protein